MTERHGCAAALGCGPWCAGDGWIDGSAKLRSNALLRGRLKGILSCSRKNELEKTRRESEGGGRRAEGGGRRAEGGG